MKDVSISEKEMKYIYLKAIKAEVMKEKVEEIQNECNKINSGNYIKEVFGCEQRKNVYKTPRIRRLIACLQNF